jgi:hypothetical protein
MKHADIFKLIVKAFGVFLLYQAVSLFTDILTAIGGSERASTPACIKIAGLVAASAWFLFGAPPIQSWAYPEARPEPAAKKTEKIEELETPETGPPCVSCGKPTPQGSQICPACGWTQPKEYYAPAAGAKSLEPS